MAQHVTVTEYNPGWQGAFRREARRIKQILGDNCVAVYHIGSTAVSGLAAKPIIDVMPVVKSLAAADGAAEAFARLGYEYLGEFGIAGRRYLRKGGDERTCQVHIFCADDEHNIFRHLAFRDYLRANAEVRGEYAALKRSLAQKYPYDIQSYCDGKEEFVKRHEALALASFDSSWDRLYLAARKIQGARALSPFIEAGGVAAALMTESGNIYSGVCIDTACSLGMCAERAAIASMISAGESRISKIVAVMPDGSAGMPCGACREFMMQLFAEAGKICILTDLGSRRFVRLEKLMPDWWGSERLKKW